MEINDWLIWLLNSGGSAVILSFILERVKWYQAQDSESKRWVFFAGSLAVSILAYCVLTYVPAEVITQISPFFLIVYTTFIANFSGSVFHAVDKNKDENLV